MLSEKLRKMREGAWRKVSVEKGSRRISKKIFKEGGV